MGASPTADQGSGAGDRVADHADGYDVIGDVHGCADRLAGLLEQMGYVDRSGVHRHPRRQAMFVGDLIDRGDRQVEVLRIVRAMVDAGAALAVMGNHEFNAISYATPDPTRPDTYLRPHTEKNNAQHAAFLDEVAFGSADHRDIVAWFGTLPFWRELGGLRVVHACWDGEAMAGMGSPVLDEDVLVDANRKGSAAHRWVEHLCKGPEIRLPPGHSFRDKDGRSRTEARVRWWDSTASTWATLCDVPPTVEPPLPDEPVRGTDLPVTPYSDDVPVIFGHYWKHWPDGDLTPTTACVDFSAVNGGPLVAYRWSGERELTSGNLVGWPRGS